MANNNDLEGQTLSEKNEIFKNIIVNAELFSNFNFSHEGSVPAFTDENYILEFNSSNNRTIKIKLLMGKIFGIKVSREIDEDPGFNYEGGFYSFNMTNWLAWAQYPYDENQYPFYVSSYNGTFEEKVNGFLNFLENAFNHSSLNGTIQGTEWGYFPFDWGTHK